MFRVSEKLRASFFSILVLIAGVLFVYEWQALHGASRSLRTDVAPYRMISLQLAADPTVASAIVKDWDSKRLVAAAQEALDLDRRFIVSYVLLGAALAILATWLAGVRWRIGAVLAMVFLFAGVCDFAENHFLARQLAGPDDVDPGDVLRARGWAMTKFVLLLLGGAPVVVLLGGGARMRLVRAPGVGAAPEPPGPVTARISDPPNARWFRALMQRENRCIFQDTAKRPDDEPVITDNRNADEPRIAFRAADVIGLALSGGGIRSATFNLGLLQGLHRRGLLPLFDYLATVSGGGYIGAFWSAWLRARKLQGEAARPIFPSKASRQSLIDGSVDTDQERHLREFSAFLAPRWGFFEVETWKALVAVLAGLLPALLIALSVIGLGLVAGLALTFPLAYETRRAGVYVTVLLTGAAFTVLELMWLRIKAASSGGTGERRGQNQYRVWAVVGTAILVAMQTWVVPWISARYAVPHFVSYRNGHAAFPDFGHSFAGWWSLVGIAAGARDAWLFSPHLFDYAASWLMTALVLIGFRFVYPLWPRPWDPETLAALDRVLMRVLGLGVVWCVLAAVWHVVINLDQAAKWIVAAAVASGGVFAALRNWIGVVLRRPKESVITARLKAYIPQVLAYLTIVLTTVAIGRLLVAIADVQWARWYLVTAAMGGVAALALFINPAEFGMHAFYRDRLNRAFTGASNVTADQGAVDNRATEPRTGDDIPLAQLEGRPLHLVCCAANDLSGDTIRTLGRGARSAVLSKSGFALGRFSAETDLTLGSAITASAAAFNSNMGSISMELGPAVSFLMTALNLRLGLWSRHPAAPVERPRRWPGLLLYREMFGLTSASGDVTERSGALDVSVLMRDVHLSDGGHFENLALYELVRRHCRYILVSDCGADPTVAFDDLGNALRRIREDFGVDISIDIEPLRPGADGFAKQHVAVGTIDYAPTDRGILLYVKPSLTGDEPPDVLQYRTRNLAFPHESTGDQFYDEAQYESYRRLGLHAAESIFDYVPPAAEPASGHVEKVPQPLSQQDVTGDWVFVEATHVWGATPDGLSESILAMTGRLAQLETSLQLQPDRPIVREVFPELAFVPAATPKDGPPKDAAHKEPSATGQAPVSISASDMMLVVRVTQLMEDVWIGCQLERWWDHPLNLGWVNLFARWATAPSYRFWWPIISPMYSPGFRRFVEERFPTPGPPDDVTPRLSNVRIPQRGRVEPLDADAPDGLAALWWKQRSTQPRHWEKRTLYQNVVDLPLPDKVGVPLQVGIVALASAGHDVGWTSDDFFVPPSLWGAGIGWYFLDNLLNELSGQAGDRPDGGSAMVYVIVKAVPDNAHQRVALHDQLAFVEQYRKIGFRRQHVNGERDLAAFNGDLLAALDFTLGGDTLFTLNLKLWAARRGRARAAPTARR